MPWTVLKRINEINELINIILVINNKFEYFYSHGWLKVVWGGVLQGHSKSVRLPQGQKISKLQTTCQETTTDIKKTGAKRVAHLGDHLVAVNAREN